MTQIPLQSRFKQDFTRIRIAEGSYVDGRYVEGTRSAVGYKGSVQPFVGRGSEVLQRLPEGDRTKKIIVVYTYPDTLRTASEKPYSTKADLIYYEGETFEVQRVNRWKGQILTHDEVWGIECDAGTIIPGVDFEGVVTTNNATQVMDISTAVALAATVTSDNPAQTSDVVAALSLAAQVESDNPVQDFDSVVDVVSAIPAFVSATISTNGRSMDVLFNQPLTAGSTAGITLTGTEATSSSFAGSTLTLVIRQVFSGATVTIQYDSGPGTIAGTGGDTVSFGPSSVANSSTFGGTWTSVGSTTTFPGGTGAVVRLGAAALNSNDLVIVDDVNDALLARRYSDPSWGVLGSNYTLSSLTYPGVCNLDGTSIAVYKANATAGLFTLTFNGSTWSQTGSQLNITGGGQGVDLCRLSSTDVLFSDSFADTMQVYRWNGSTWSTVGNAYSLGGISGVVRATALTSTLVAVVDASVQALNLYTFDGTDWSIVSGSSISTTSNTRPCLCALNTTDIVLANASEGTLMVHRWSGSAWSAIGTNYDISTPDTAGTGMLVYMGDNEVAFMRASTSNSFLRRFAWG